MVTRSSDPSGIKVEITPPPAKMITEGEGIQSGHWVMERRSISCGFQTSCCSSFLLTFLIKVSLQEERPLRTTEDFSLNLHEEVGKGVNCGGSENGPLDFLLCKASCWCPSD